MLYINNYKIIHIFFEIIFIKMNNTNHINHKINNNNWNILIAIKIAKHESIKMTYKHWEIIYCIRSFYIKFKINVPNRILLKIIKKKIGIKKSNNQYLLSLFPKGIIKQASKIAGLPKSKICL